MIMVRVMERVRVVRSVVVMRRVRVMRGVRVMRSVMVMRRVRVMRSVRVMFPPGTGTPHCPLTQHSAPSAASPVAWIQSTKMQCNVECINCI